MRWSDAPHFESVEPSQPGIERFVMALGIPSVANDIPDQKRVIAESGAGLCVTMEARPFEAAVLELLNDGALAARFALRGPPYVKTHRTYDILGNNVAKTYKKILTGT